MKNSDQSVYMYEKNLHYIYLYITNDFKILPHLFTYLIDEIHKSDDPVSKPTENTCVGVPINIDPTRYDYQKQNKR